VLAFVFCSDHAGTAEQAIDANSERVAIGYASAHLNDIRFPANALQKSQGACFWIYKSHEYSAFVVSLRRHHLVDISAPQFLQRSILNPYLLGLRLAFNANLIRARCGWPRLPQHFHYLGRAHFKPIVFHTSPSMRQSKIACRGDQGNVNAGFAVDRAYSGEEALTHS
jgi:hypothetical protein